MMAEKNCTRAQGPCCRLDWLQRRRALEDMPTTHIDARDTQEASVDCGSCCCRWSELEARLECQNKLLCDILGALNALTAAQLAQQKG